MSRSSLGLRAWRHNMRTMLDLIRRLILVNSRELRLWMRKCLLCSILFLLSSFFIIVLLIELSWETRSLVDNGGRILNKLTHYILIHAWLILLRVKWKNILAPMRFDFLGSNVLIRCIRRFVIRIAHIWRTDKLSRRCIYLTTIYLHFCHIHFHHL